MWVVVGVEDETRISDLCANLHAIFNISKSLVHIYLIIHGGRAYDAEFDMVDEMSSYILGTGMA